MPFLAKDNDDFLANIFSGNELLPGSQPIAQAYSGHQFGHFNPQLGDGRAHLLGDITDANGQSWDVQLKGSGTSFFSRQGDGRCALAPALREFIMSEAMYALGVPTTRCLAVVATGQAVYREQTQPGAIVTRVATSHIRVGTFQYFALRKDIESLKKLTSYAIVRHYPELTTTDNSSLTSEQVLEFFAAVLNKQVKLVVSWLRVGFIHGVMNTDNTAISGETIDYGPCAMMNHYHPDTVFSSIDRNGRYAFANQSKIMQWNMARFADCLLPLVDDDEQLALDKITPLLQQFANDLQYRYFDMMADKLGIAELANGDVELVNDLLAIMAEKRLDYTQTFLTLADNLTPSEVARVIDLDNDSIKADTWQQWLNSWYKRVEDDVHSAKKLMAKSNPRVIPRNHHVEGVLASTQQIGDLSPLQQFLNVLQQPYSELPETANYQDRPVDGGDNYQTFCGT
jgi:uncharacterized protein YdiU (UPF0061 family)